MFRKLFNKKEREKNLLLFSFLLIPTILLIMFVIYPTIKLLIMSFTDWNGISDEMNFIGFKNYLTIFKKRILWKSLGNNGLYLIIHLIFIPFELYIAMLLDRFIKKSDFFKSIIFMPYIINGVAVAYMFNYIYSSDRGVLNSILGLFGIAGVGWLSNEHIVNFSLVGVSLWRFTGVHIVLFLAGLQSISMDMLEAAEIDGASVFQQYWYIILPNMTTVLQIILFLNVRGALMVFDIPFVMTSGGPGTASSTFVVYAINMAFKYSDFGMAATMSIVLIIMIGGLSYIQNLIINKLGGK